MLHVGIRVLVDTEIANIFFGFKFLHAHISVEICLCTCVYVALKCDYVTSKIRT